MEGKALPADLLTGLGHIRRRSACCAPLGRRHAMWWCEIDRQDTAPVHHCSTAPVGLHWTPCSLPAACWWYPSIENPGWPGVPHQPLPVAAAARLAAGGLLQPGCGLALGCTPTVGISAVYPIGFVVGNLEPGGLAGDRSGARGARAAQRRRAAGRWRALVAHLPVNSRARRLSDGLPVCLLKSCMREGRWMGLY